MVSISVVNDANAQLALLKKPTTAVFVGGTRGIGRATLFALARRKTSNLKVYVVGRQETDHQDLLHHLRLLNSHGKFIFLEAQITLLAEVKRVCDEIRSMETSVSLLWLSAGALPFDGRKETSEGLSIHMTLAYWGRMLFITLLLPLLKASSANPRVVSILRAGDERTDLDLNDLDIKAPVSNTAFLNKYAAIAQTMNSLQLEQFAAHNPEVVFVHKYPGLVRTDLFGQGWGRRWSARRVLFTYIVPRIVGLVGLSETEVGERCLFTLFSARYGGTGQQIDGVGVLRNSMGGYGHEGVFLVGANDESVVEEIILEKLREMGASNRVYEETRKILEPYL